jgi:hypothetical protein
VCLASRQNFHFVAQLGGNKSNHLFHGSWASSMFSGHGRDLPQVKLQLPWWLPFPCSC